MTLYLDTWIALGFLGVALLVCLGLQLLSKTDTTWTIPILGAALAVGIVYGLRWLF
jgi:hypothetical protein